MILRVLGSNIRDGGAGREDALAAVIRAADPDVVFSQQATEPAAPWRATPGIIPRARATP
ncbi:MAG: hypothetical protein ACXWZS_10410 [Gemmatirosa sp.]